MSMPKGFKSDKGYATVTSIPNGMDYRTIAEKMTAEGDPMNHATARNIFLKAMCKIAEPMRGLYQLDTDAEGVIKTAKDPEFQAGVIDMMDDLGMTSL